MKVHEQKVISVEHDSATAWWSEAEEDDVQVEVGFAERADDLQCSVPQARDLFAALGRLLKEIGEEVDLDALEDEAPDESADPRR